MAKILVVDDDQKILRLLKNTLELNEHKVDIIDNATKVNLDHLSQYNLIILDIMMPDMDGLTFCKKIRDLVQCPILFLTAKTEETAVVKGLLNGGDDYIKKPFGVSELNARVDAHLRREIRKKQSKKLIFDGIVLDLERYEIIVNGEKMILTKKQYKICEYLALNHGLVFSKEQIYEAVYSHDSETLLSTITEHIHVIRNKFKGLGLNPIKTIWGVGYKWE